MIKLVRENLFESLNEDWWDIARPEEPKGGSFKDSKYDEEDRIKRLNIEREKKYRPTFPPESLVFAINNEENEIAAIIVPDPRRFAYVGPVNVDNEDFHEKFTKEEGEIAYHTTLSIKETEEFLLSIGMKKINEMIKINFKRNLT